MARSTTRIAAIASAAALAALLSACASTDRSTPVAEAIIKPTEGNNISGYIRFYQSGKDTMRVNAQVKGLAPNSERGFHIHENGNCSAPDAMSAGGHYNPGGHKHGKVGAESHVGDLPSLMADSTGVANLVYETKNLSIGTGLPTDVKGRAVVVHKDKDDYTTQPTGNSGARIGCGVIQ